MFPTDKGESVSNYVSRILEMFRDSGVDYRLTPMGTIFEVHSMREAMDLIADAYAILEPDCNRVYSSIKIDARKGKGLRMEGKIRSVKDKIGDINI